MAEIIFVVGGARSGKSAHAVALAGEMTTDVAYVATCEPLDGEMKVRIDLHKKSRPRSWKTYEEPVELSKLAAKIAGRHDAVLVDCLTLFVSNMMHKGFSEAGIKKEILAAIKAFRKARGRLIIVSNEVGLGIVPDTKMGRDFRDVAGRINQVVAKEADRVIFTVSGIPLTIKGGDGK